MAVDDFVRALRERDVEGARACVSALAWERRVERFVRQAIERAEIYAVTDTKLALEREAVVIERAGERRGRVWVLLEDDTIVGVTSERAEAMAFVLQWLGGTTTFDELDVSLEGALWATELATRLQDESARAVLGSVRGEPEVIDAAIRRIESARQALGRVRWASLGARVLKSAQRVSIGLAALGPDSDSEAVWLTVELPEPFTLIASAGTSSFRPLLADVVERAYEAAAGLVGGAEPTSDALSKLLARVTKAEGPELAVTDRKVALLIARLARTLAARDGQVAADQEATVENALRQWLDAAAQGRAASEGKAFVAELMAAALRS